MKLEDIIIEAVNLNYRKQYNEALKLLDSYFEFAINREDISQFHIDYAMNYEKLKELEKCNYHCEKAIKLYHCGIYAYKRLIINYIKAKHWKNALRICDMTLERMKKSKQLEKENKSNIGYKGSPLNWGEFDFYVEKRKKFILKKIGDIKI